MTAAGPSESQSRRVAVVPVRGGVLPAGAAEAVAEVGGDVVIVGDAAATAADALLGVAVNVTVIETPTFAAGADAARVAPIVADAAVVLLPASADGRDLAPRLAADLERPLYANAVQLRDTTVSLARHGGMVLAEQVVAGPCVVTLQPGVRTVEVDDDIDAVVTVAETPAELTPTGDGSESGDAVVVEVLAPDVTTMDLSEAPRILGGGAGLDGAARFEQLSEIATAIGASMGATRVITDRGWIGHSRQIGTTGVVVDPDLYLAFGISGAVQHTAGLGDPDHIISVNLDPHCPMMDMADLAIVTDANQTLDELTTLLVERAGAESDGAESKKAEPDRAEPDSVEVNGG